MSYSLQQVSKLLPTTFRKEFIDTLEFHRTPEAQQQDRIDDANSLYSEFDDIREICSRLTYDTKTLDEQAYKVMGKKSTLKYRK